MMSIEESLKVLDEIAEGFEKLSADVCARADLIAMWAGRAKGIRQAIALIKANLRGKPNDLLTLEQLREMDGEPVFIKCLFNDELSSYVVVYKRRDSAGIFTRLFYASFDYYGDEWLAYLYVTEHKHGDGRWHHHILINSTGSDYELIRTLWGQGNAEFKSLRVDREKNYETLARYFCKEQRDKVGQRLWSGSRNLRKPEKECFRVPNDTPLSPPKSSPLVLEDTGDVSTAYGHYRYIKYLARGAETSTAPKARRRRKRRIKAAR